MEDEPPIYHLPHDTLHQIFSSLPLRQIIICRSLSKFFHHLLTTPPFLHLLSTTLPPLNLLALRHNHHHQSPLHLFDPDLDHWLRFPLDFLPFRSPLPVASSRGLLYLWAEPIDPFQPLNSSTPTKSLLACNPITRQFRVLPHLGSAWCRHGCVLVDSAHRVMVLTELAALYYSAVSDTDNSNNRWMKFSSNLPSKPRSPVLVGDSAFALCEVGSPWRSQWKLFTCRVAPALAKKSWSRLERNEWGDVFDILKRPRLVRGAGDRVLMVGGLKSSFSLNAPCSTILILRLDLGTLEWDKAGRMPPEMFRCFQEAGKFKVFGAGDRVCFSAKRIGKLALWDRNADQGAEWRWIDNVPGNGDGLYRGFVFEGRLDALP
ncbi:SKP1-interacting partner 15 [Lotus japonicus]|uniref:SKP1-interacting partner 15 n=1 Tax=Lotus japonicus TaxID=34305 RepID=UPI00258BCDC8|nr:SKP1-interacting partner 15 [Lotus japonicus]